MLIHPQFDPVAIQLGPLAVQWALQSAGEVTPGALQARSKGARS